MSTVTALRFSRAYCSFSDFALANHSQPMISATSAQPGHTGCSSSAWQRSLCSVCLLQVVAAVHFAKTGAA